MNKGNRKRLIWRIVIIILVLLIILLFVLNKRNHQRQLSLSEDMRFSLLVEYFDDSRVRHSLSYSTPHNEVTVNGDPSHQIKELDQGTLKAYSDALAKLKDSKYTLASMSDVLNDVPSCELLLNTFDGDHVYLIISNTGEVYQRLDELIPNMPVFVGRPQLLIKYEGGEDLYDLIKSSVSQ